MYPCKVPYDNMKFSGLSFFIFTKGNDFYDFLPDETLSERDLLLKEINCS